MEWIRAQHMIRAVPYLIKSLKRHGFKTEVLVNVYRSLALSHITYSAPLLTSTSEKVKGEMSSYHTRVLRTIGISPATAKANHNLVSINELIENSCVKLLKRILEDTNHPLTSKLPRVGRSNKSFTFTTRIARTVAYQNSFVQRYTRRIRDGCEDLYTTRKSAQAQTNNTNKTAKNATRSAIPKRLQ